MGKKLCESAFVLFFSCTEAVMLERLTERGKTSGRVDDNTESILKRFREFLALSTFTTPRVKKVTVGRGAWGTEG